MKVKLMVAVVIAVATWSWPSVARTLPEFTDLIEKSSPAVVKISTLSKGNGFNNQFPQNQEIPEFFRYFFDPRQIPQQPQGSMGSGFFISADGYLLTNNHVVAGADEITVHLQDRREYDAEVIGTDERSDLALLKIDAKSLPFLAFAKPDDVRVGEWVVAIGSPFGLDYTASVGIVSAIGRSIPNSSNETYVPFIQTDVAINPGNSGGPLFNLDGEVVGINSQIYTRSGGYMGLSFAIPASVAVSVVEQLKDKGHVDRGWLGVQIGDVTRELAEALGLKKPTGAVLVDVVAGSPAEDAGFKPEDVILKFNGVDILTSSDLPPVVGRTTPGKKVPVEIMREMKRLTLTVEIGILGSDRPLRRSSLPNPPPVEGGRLGMVVDTPDNRLLDSLNLEGGVVVRTIVPGGPAAKSGLVPGDLIVSIGFKAISGLDSYSAIAKDLPVGTLLPIRFYHEGRPQFRTIQIEE